MAAACLPSQFFFQFPSYVFVLDCMALHFSCSSASFLPLNSSIQCCIMFFFYIHCSKTVVHAYHLSWAEIKVKHGQSTAIWMVHKLAASIVEAHLQTCALLAFIKLWVAIQAHLPRAWDSVRHLKTSIMFDNCWCETRLVWLRGWGCQMTWICSNDTMKLVL